MARFGNVDKDIIAGLIVIFVVLGAILLAIALYDDTTTADRTAMGCFGIAFTAMSILMVAFLGY
jgi:TRAP-type mannitol/chloroaromatic compound transport system permease large subunit